MIKHFLLFAAIIIAGLSVNTPAKADCDLTITQPFAYATADLQKNGAAFFTIHNHSDVDDRLIGARSDAAKHTEMHTHTLDNGVMKMREVEGYDAPAGSIVKFEPMGHHIMLIGLKDKLVMGDAFSITLTFEKSGEQKIPVNIIAPGTKPPHKDHHEHH